MYVEREEYYKLSDMIRCMLKQTKFPINYWGEARRNGTFIINIIS
jgi:hypothetical protein